jgi:hypothetical protein
MLPLAVDAENALRPAPFRFDAIKAAVASDIEHGLAGEISGQTLLDHFPGFAWMIDRLAHHAFGFGEYSVAEIDPMKPRLENFQAGQDFVARHNESKSRAHGRGRLLRA